MIYLDGSQPHGDGAPRCAALCNVRAPRELSAALGSRRRRRGGARGGGRLSLDQVSPTRRYKERSPPLPVLSEHTIFYLVDTITLFTGPGACAKVTDDSKLRCAELSLGSRGSGRASAWCCRGAGGTLIRRVGTSTPTLTHLFER